MRIAAPHGLAQFFNEVWRSRLVRVAHTEINDVLAPCARSLLQFTDDIEDVGRETLNALKMGIHEVDARFKCRLIKPQ